jgi:hypothetical protein
MPNENLMVWVFLPEFYNPDEKGNTVKVEEEKFIQTADEMAILLDGGGTLWKNPRPDNIQGITGIWYDKHRRYVDNMRILVLEIQDTPQKREWIQHHIKNHLLDRFKQSAIYSLIIPKIQPILIRNSI